MVVKYNFKESRPERVYHAVILILKITRFMLYFTFNFHLNYSTQLKMEKI